MVISCYSVNLLGDRNQLEEFWAGVLNWVLSRISHAPIKLIEMGLKLIQGVVCCGLVDLRRASIQTSIWKLFIFSDPHACTLVTVQFMIFVVSLFGLQEACGTPHQLIFSGQLLLHWKIQAR